MFYYYSMLKIDVQKLLLVNNITIVLLPDDNIKTNLTWDEISPINILFKKKQYFICADPIFF